MAAPAPQRPVPMLRHPAHRRRGTYHRVRARLRVSEPVITRYRVVRLRPRLGPHSCCQTTIATAERSAVSLGIIGLGLIVFQPGPAAMDLLSWSFGHQHSPSAAWMFIRGETGPCPGPPPMAPRAAVTPLAAVRVATDTPRPHPADDPLCVKCHGDLAALRSILAKSVLAETPADWGPVVPAASVQQSAFTFERDKAVRRATGRHRYRRRTCTPCSKVQRVPTCWSVPHLLGRTCATGVARPIPRRGRWHPARTRSPAKHPFTAEPDYPGLLRPCGASCRWRPPWPAWPWVPLCIARRVLWHPRS